MSKLKSVIQQLQESECQEIQDRFKQTGAWKYMTLFNMLREGVLNDEKMREELEMNNSAFYTIKSRLLDKIQEYLSAQFINPSIDSSSKIEDIPELLYNTQRNKAVAILSQLEVDMQQQDNPYKLASIYNALKKLHINSPKFYHYAQMYNRHLAYTIALDKAEDLLIDFFRKLADYELSKTNINLQLLSLIKQELHNVAKLYESHHLTIYKNIVDICSAIYLPQDGDHKAQQPIELMLNQMEQIFNQNRNDKDYMYLKLVHRYLAFEYYHIIGLHNREEEYYNPINENLSSFLNYNHCCFPSKFLISKAERMMRINKEDTMLDEMNELLSEYVPDIQDVPNYMLYCLYKSICNFNLGKYTEAAGVLVRMSNEVSFKNYYYAEIEIRLFQALCYLLASEKELVMTHLRGVSRKLKELEEDIGYDNARAFYRLLYMVANPTSKNMAEKIKQHADRFKFLNHGEKKMLTYLKLDDKLINKLSELEFEEDKI